MSDERQVGRVLGSEHSNTSAFRVVLDEHDFLQLDDLIVVRRWNEHGVCDERVIGFDTAAYWAAQDAEGGTR